MRTKAKPTIFVTIEQQNKRALLDLLATKFHTQFDIHFFDNWIDLLPALAKTCDHRLPALIVLSVATKRTGAYNVLSWLEQHDRYQHIPTLLLEGQNTEVAF